ncbi:MAG: gliding motility-associated C-terminal domain-containing protein [Prevotellaceae bacterium]|jgi:gliding motility-associated-like protein|nr:gliding motility-associated C-terminal domain-containing protein [Prevotellaceae bacterium]
MKKLAALTVGLLLALSAFAQITAPSAAYNDSTAYFRTDTVNVTQDKIFVFFTQTGQLSASQPKGDSARFTWQQLYIDSIILRIDTITPPYATFDTVKIDTTILRIDTIVSFPDTTFDTLKTATLTFHNIFVDTAELKQSSTLDTIRYGCYRVCMDTMRCAQLDSTLDSAFLRIDTIVNENVLPPDTTFDTIYSYFYNYFCSRWERTPADTLRAWVFIDSFSLCDIIVESTSSCDDPLIYGLFYPSLDPDKECTTDQNFHYTYFDLATPGEYKELNYPEGYSVYLKSTRWTPSRNIHEGTDFVDDRSWQTSLTTFIPSPFYDATYTLEVVNYFGHRAERESDTVYAYKTYAQMEVYTGKKEDGATTWSTTPEAGEEHDAPLYVRAKNTSINAKPISYFDWIFYENKYEWSDTARPQVYYATQTTSADDYVSPPDPYQPGEYGIDLIVRNQNGCADTASSTIRVKEFVINPDDFTTVFTPSSSTGENLYFKIKNPDDIHSITSFEVNVFNRWGQLYFRSTDIRFQWDGKIRGTNSMAEDGVYFYTVKAQGLNLKQKKITQKFKGNIHKFR